MFCSNRQISAVAFTHSRKSEVSNTEKIRFKNFSANKIANFCKGSLEFVHVAPMKERGPGGEVCSSST